MSAVFIKTVDGGETWTRTLGDDEWVGATDLVIDPRDPDVLYAATWQRHRNVAAYMGGGPGSGLHKSTDGGETWVELTKGIPKSNLGKNWPGDFRTTIPITSMLPLS